MNAGLGHRVGDSVWIEGMIKRFINDSPENRMGNDMKEKAWAEPLLGFSNGADLLYQFFKEDIGEFYLLPIEIFKHSFPDVDVASNQLTVISWILPQTEATKSDQRKQTRFPCERWVRTRVYGEEVNNKLRRHVVNVLLQAGYKAVAPVLSSLWTARDSSKYLYASTWSERHATYAAGLGTFGLCDGLITPKGKAMRCGSVISKIDIQPSGRPYDNHRAYCLFYAKGTCGECISRCPSGALSKAGHDKTKCLNYLQITKEYAKTHYGFEGYGCGLCQTGVPCESRIPHGLQ